MLGEDYRKRMDKIEPSAGLIEQTKAKMLKAASDDVKNIRKEEKNFLKKYKFAIPAVCAATITLIIFLLPAVHRNDVASIIRNEPSYKQKSDNGNYEQESKKNISENSAIDNDKESAQNSDGISSVENNFENSGIKKTVVFQKSYSKTAEKFEETEASAKTAKHYTTSEYDVSVSENNSSKNSSAVITDSKVRPHSDTNVNSEKLSSSKQQSVVSENTNANNQKGETTDPFKKMAQKKTYGEISNSSEVVENVFKNVGYNSVDCTMYEDLFYYYVIGDSGKVLSLLNKNYDTPDFLKAGQMPVVSKTSGPEIESFVGECSSCEPASTVSENTSDGKENAIIDDNGMITVLNIGVDDILSNYKHLVTNYYKPFYSVGLEVTIYVDDKSVEKWTVLGKKDGLEIITAFNDCGRLLWMKIDE